MKWPMSLISLLFGLSSVASTYSQVLTLVNESLLKLLLLRMASVYAGNVIGDTAGDNLGVYKSSSSSESSSNCSKSENSLSVKIL